MENNTILTYEQKNRIKLFEISFCIYVSWFFLPICKGYIFGGIYNLIFFCFYALAMGNLLLLNLRTHFKRDIWLVVYPVICYMLVMCVMYLLDVKDADKHIRVSFTFWGILLYYFLLDKYSESRIRIAKYVLCLYVITYITTLIGITTDVTAARTISHAASNDELSASLLRKNISSIYFIQMSVMFVPFAVSVLLNKKKGRLPALGFLILEFFFIMQASFTVSLIMYFIVLALSIVFLKEDEDKYALLAKTLLLGVVIFLMIVVDWKFIFKWLGENIENSYISQRMLEMSNLLDNSKDTGDAGLRLELYLSSIKTFSENLFGVGPNYSYIKFDEGIGHHSQMLDDFARFGVAAVCFYFVFLKNYYKFLKQKYSAYSAEKIAIPILCLYILFLILNLSFRSADEAIMMFLIIPEMMTLTEKKSDKSYKNKK